MEDYIRNLFTFRGNILLTGEALIFLTSKYELLLNKTVLIEGTKGVSLSNMLDTMCVIHQKEVSQIQWCVIH